MSYRYVKYHETFGVQFLKVSHQITWHVVIEIHDVVAVQHSLHTIVVIKYLNRGRHVNQQQI